MYNFTDREKEVIRLLTDGKTNKEIAEILYISYHTVKATVEHIYDKTGVHNRVLLTFKIAREMSELIAE